MLEPGRLQATVPSGLVFWIRLLLYVNGVFWVVAAGWTAWSWGPRGDYMPLALLVTLMLGNAVILSGLAHRLRGLGPSVLIAAPIWVAINLVLSFADDVGLADLLVGLLNLGTLALLLSLGVMWWQRRRDR